MKKLLGSALAIAMLVQPGFASAELLKNFKLSGQLDLQANATRNVTDFVTRQDALSGLHGAGAGNWVDANGNGIDDNTGNIRPAFNDRMNDARTRVLLHMDWDLIENSVHAKITLRKNDRAWGDNGGDAVGGNSASQSLSENTGVNGVDGGNDIGSSVAIDQAYVKIDKVFGQLDATLGRQYYGTSGDFVVYFGPSDKAQYGLPTRTIDAARVDFMNLPFVNITGIAGKTTGVSIGTVANADVDVRGMEISVKEIENVNLDFFVYNRLTHATGALGHFDDRNPATDTLVRAHGGNDNLYVYGFRTKVTLGNFMAKLNLAVNGGENRQPGALAWVNRSGQMVTGDLANTGYTPPDGNYTGYAWTVDAEYKAEVEDIASFTPWMHFAWGSGRKDLYKGINEGFTAIAPDYRPATIYGRYSGTTSLPLGNGIPCIIGVLGCNADYDQDGTLDAALADGNWDPDDGGIGRLTNPMGVAGGISGTGLNNRVIWGLGLKTTPAFAKDLTFSFSFWDFRFQRVTQQVKWFTGASGFVANLSDQDCQVRPCLLVPNSGAGGYNAGATDNFGQGRGQKHIGNEIDLDMTYKHSDAVEFSAGVASFRPGKFIQEVVRDQYNAGIVNGVASGLGPGTHVSVNPVVLAYGDMRIKF